VDRLLALNGWQEDWPLQIGQKLMISPGNIPPSPTLSAIQKLSPEADGKYYHTVRSGETLSWIADLYDIPLSDLMTWNGLNNTSVIRPEQKLLLLLTLPATLTPTPSTVTITPSPYPSITQLPPTGTLAAEPVRTTGSPRRFELSLILGMITIGLGGLLWSRFSRKK
jgi:hypothetical protein